MDTDKNGKVKSEMLPENYHIASIPDDQIGNYVRIDWFAIDPDPETPVFYCDLMGEDIPKSMGILADGTPLVMTGYSLISLS